MDEKRLYTWQECSELDIKKIQNLYRKYVNNSQVDLIGSFGFGRTSMVKAEGVYIYTADNRKILDFTGGVGVLTHGHNHPRILEARVAYQREKRPEVHKNFLSQYIAGLSYNIAQLLPEDLNISYFCNSGAEAVEGSVKLAFKYHDGKRRYILHSDISFHGKLLGAAGLTGSPELHYQYPTIPFIDAFKYNDLDSLEKAIAKHRKGNSDSDIYAIILEPFRASSLLECSTEFLRELRDICTKEKIILIFDEVYSGWAKTGELFYFMKDNIIPDIVIYSKSFGGGKASISGYTTRTPIFKKAYDNSNDAILHSTTFNGFGEECITAIEAINIILEKNFIDKANSIHKRLFKGLKELQKKYPHIIDEVRGCGALNGIILNDELNAALKTAISFLPGKIFQDPRFAAKLVTSSVISELYNTHGILTFYGSNLDIPLIISPSLVITDDELVYFLESLDKTLAQGKYKLISIFLKEKIFN